MVVEVTAIDPMEILVGEFTEEADPMPGLNSKFEGALRIKVIFVPWLKSEFVVSAKSILPIVV